MKKLLLLLFFVPFWAQAQLSLSVQLPPAGPIQKDQLWNLILTNSGNATVEIAILLNLQDAQTGQSVLTAATNSMSLPMGVKIVSAAEGQPIQYNFGTSLLGGDFLPLGSYVACYTVTKRAGEVVDKVLEECVRMTINPLSPPLLNTPSDKAVLLSAPSQFSWLPPAPKDIFQELSYDLTLTEVMPGQSPQEAILYNNPLYVKSKTQALFDYYPSSFSSLETGKTYAWQVTARNGQNYAAATEVWSFAIKPDTTKQEGTTTAYIELKRKDEPSGIHYLSTDTVKVKYYSFEKDYETLVRFTDVHGKRVQEKKQTLRYGDNYLLFPLNPVFRNGEVYHIEITDLQNHRSTATFSIKQPN